MQQHCNAAALLVLCGVIGVVTDFMVRMQQHCNAAAPLVLCDAIGDRVHG
jgi:hypothetical protein